ncbi:MAG TPA: cell division protein FtsZ [Candidatus Rifleibacterium sp.]|nr:cell division protein FtsZ [Candidatus Rifleibacterium sp.]
MKFFKLDEDYNAKSDGKHPCIKVIGVGGCGKNSLNRLMEANLANIEFIAANTDKNSLSIANAPVKILMGKEFMTGHGTGGRPGLGKKAAGNARHEIIEALEGAEMVLLTATLGGGTGSGAAPVIASLAHEMGALVVAFVTRPFRFEGHKRARRARESVKKLKKFVDVLFEFNNETLLEQMPENLSMIEAFASIDRYFCEAMQCFVNLLQPNLISISGEGLRNIIDGYCEGCIAIGHGAGENMTTEAVNMALADHAFKIDRSRAENVLVNLTTGPEASMAVVANVCEMVAKSAGDQTGLLYSHSVSKSMVGRLKLTLVFLRPRSR